MLVQTVKVDVLDQLLVNLRGVRSFDVAAVNALLGGYRAAVEFGTTYRVTGAHGQARHVLQRTGTSDVLADSDDLGALILAALLHPPTIAFP